MSPPASGREKSAANIQSHPNIPSPKFAHQSSWSRRPRTVDAAKLLRFSHTPIARAIFMWKVAHWARPSNALQPPPPPPKNPPERERHRRRRLRMPAVQTRPTDRPTDARSRRVLRVALSYKVADNGGRASSTYLPFERDATATERTC